MPLFVFRLLIQVILNYQEFWSSAAQAVSWHKPFTSVLDRNKAPFYSWFAGGQVNTCYNAVDRHCESGWFGFSTFFARCIS